MRDFGALSSHVLSDHFQIVGCILRDAPVPCYARTSPWPILTPIRQEKKAQRLTFCVRRLPGGVVVFHAKGWGLKSSCPFPNLLWVGLRRRELGISREFCRDVPDPRGVQKDSAKKMFVLIFGPYPRASSFFLFFEIQWGLPRLLRS